MIAVTIFKTTAWFSDTCRSEYAGESLTCKRAKGCLLYRFHGTNNALKANIHVSDLGQAWEQLFKS